MAFAAGQFALMAHGTVHCAASRVDPMHELIPRGMDFKRGLAKMTLIALPFIVTLVAAFSVEERLFAMASTNKPLVLVGLGLYLINVIVTLRTIFRGLCAVMALHAHVHFRKIIGLLPEFFLFAFMAFGAVWFAIEMVHVGVSHNEEFNIPFAHRL